MDSSAVLKSVMEASACLVAALTVQMGQMFLTGAEPIINEVHLACYLLTGTGVLFALFFLLPWPGQDSSAGARWVIWIIMALCCLPVWEVVWAVLTHTVVPLFGADHDVWTIAFLVIGVGLLVALRAQGRRISGGAANFGGGGRGIVGRGGGVQGSPMEALMAGFMGLVAGHPNGPGGGVHELQFRHRFTPMPAGGMPAAGGGDGPGGGAGGRRPPVGGGTGAGGGQGQGEGQGSAAGTSGAGDTQGQEDQAGPSGERKRSGKK